MKHLASTFLWIAAAGFLMVVGGAASAAPPPRSQRVAERIAERAYARQSIAEARATRAAARVAEIAPVVPVPPPPRPATVRRMARAGVPLGPPARGPLPARLPPAPAPAFVSAPPTTPPPISLPAAVATPPKEASDVVTNDGTRSVLAAAEEPATQPATRAPAGPAVTHPPIELLPTPQPQ